MKKSKMHREILKVLKSWEGSKLEINTAKEVLAKMEEPGMLPPWSEEFAELVKPYNALYGYNWDYEK
jgi:hypothetical protein